jgi:predicted glutamine amidotransferase
MCIAIYNPSEAPDLTLKALESCRTNNPDGMGFMYALEGRLHIVRQMRRKSRFFRRYQQARQLGVDVVLHFRIATHGYIDIDNAHPIQVSDNLAFVHNGILPKWAPKDPRNPKSDTRRFARNVLKWLPDGWLQSKKVRTMVERDTQGSRLVFLDSQAHATILHENSGVWHNGSWFSNGSYKEDYYASQYDWDSGWTPQWGKDGRLTNRNSMPTDGTVEDWVDVAESYDWQEVEQKDGVKLLCRVNRTSGRVYSSFEDAWNDRYTTKVLGKPSVKDVENPEALDGIHLTSWGPMCEDCVTCYQARDEARPLWDDGEPIQCANCGEWHNV